MQVDTNLPKMTQIDANTSQGFMNVIAGEGNKSNNQSFL